MTQKGSVSIIVATTAAPERRETLKRALDSILTQSAGDVRPVVVVNGALFDPALVAELRDMPGIDFHYREQGSLPAAILYGRGQVETEFFGFLDDDDVLLSDAVDIRRNLIDADDGYDVAVTAGFRQSGESRVAYDIDPIVCRENSLAALTRQNWLASCAGLYRTATVDRGYFENLQKYAEWTDVAFRLALDRRINFGNQKTYVIEYSEESLSKHPDFALAPSLLMRRLLRADLPADVRRLLEAKYVEELHNSSEFCRGAGRLGEAWRLHLRCLVTPGGAKYLPYSRHLFRFR